MRYEFVEQFVEGIISFKTERNNGQLNARSLRLFRDSIVSGNRVVLKYCEMTFCLAPFECMHTLCRQNCEHAGENADHQN